MSRKEATPKNEAIPMKATIPETSKPDTGESHLIDSDTLFENTSRWSDGILRPSKGLSEEEMTKKKENLARRVELLSNGKVLVVGDICLDEYLFGEVKRISPEAPVPVLEVKSQEARLGLAANVAQNVKSLGGECHLLGVVGGDETSHTLGQLLKEAGVSQDFLICDRDRPTTKKTRLISGNHHIARVDFETRKFLSSQTRSELLDRAKQILPSVDVVVIEDYAKGVFCEKTTQSLISMAHKENKKVFVDPHRTTPIRYYRGADVFKPNRDEAFLLSGLNIDELREDDEALTRVANKLVELVSCEHLIITLGKEGMLHFEETKTLSLPTEAKQIFDVTGAGDTVIATLALACASGFTLDEACILANSAAGIVVGKVGCVPCYQGELLDQLLKELV